jgi:DNA-binding Lrp family transcriptional regulator
LATGFVLLSVEPGMEREVFKEIIRIKNVVDVHLLFGEYDLIARVEAEDYNYIGDIIINKIRTIPGVIATKTLTKISL